MLGNDDPTLKQIKRRTSTFGRLVGISIVVGAVGLGIFYYKRSEAYEQRMDGVLEAGKMEDREQMLAKLREELQKASYDDVKVRIMRNLGHFDDEKAVPLMIKELENGGVVRRAAALALARIGSPEADAAKPKLLEVLPKTDERDRPQVVWALAVLKEPQASDAILTQFTKGMLQGQPGFDPKVITDVLGTQKLSSPELTNHEEKSVRTLVATALAEAGSSEVVDPLLRMIKREDEDAEVVRIAAAGLARTGDPRVAEPLFNLMQRRAELRQSVLDALRRSTAAPQIAKLAAEANDASVRRDLTEILRDMHDPRVADQLAQLAQAEDQDTRVEAAHGLAELGDPRAVPILLELAKDEDDSMAQRALAALEDLGHPSAAEGLLAMLDDFPGRKASIFSALGTSGAEEAGPRLVKALEGDDVGAAATALGRLEYEPAFPKLLKMVDRPKDVDFTKPSVVSEMAYRNRVEALRGLAYFGRPEAADKLIEVIEDPEDDYRIQAEAGKALGLIADDALKQRILQKIQNKELEKDMRVAYVQGLWRKPDQALAAKLMPMLSSSETPAQIRRAAALAVGYVGDPAHDAKLQELLKSEEDQTLRNAAFAVVLGGSEEAADVLLTAMEDNRDLREVLRYAITNEENDNFNVVTKSAFESGQIYRRLRVARAMGEGDEDEKSYSYVWNQVISRLKAGWDGPNGVTPRYIRSKLYEALTGDDAARRELAAEVLTAMGERGLLLAARDSEGPGSQEAREQLLDIKRPLQQT